MDIMKYIRAIPEWNDLIKLPAKVAELEKRIAALENKETSFDACPACKQTAFKLISSKPDPVMGEVGVVLRHYRCDSCGFEEQQKVTP